MMMNDRFKVAGILLSLGVPGFAADVPTATVGPAPRYLLPGVYREQRPQGGGVDCNSPAHWDGETLYVFSSENQPWRTSGPNLMDLKRRSERTSYDNEVNGGRWIESTYKDKSGKLYGWYHREPHPVCEGGPEKHRLTAPLIGAAVSDDNGKHWKDLGIVLEAPADSKNCDSPNHYFVGGNGDFSVILDNDGKHFYFFISTYNKDVAEQGVSVARMKHEDRDEPVGKVYKWHKGEWKEPGLGGHVTPIWPAAVTWHADKVDAFWGASVHYNTHLKQYVILLNRAQDRKWAQEGIYVTFNPDVANPNGWSKPVRILEPKDLEYSKWYPQVIGTDAQARETDKLAGKKARLFVAGLSKWEITFHRPGEGAP